MMLSALSLLVLLPASAVMAAGTQRLGNNTFVLEERQTFTNVEMTWYPSSAFHDACTGEMHQNSDFDVAMNFDLFQEGGCCGKQLIITVNGKTATANCVDECATCPQIGQLDLTEGLFEFFAGFIFLTVSCLGGIEIHQNIPELGSLRPDFLAAQHVTTISLGTSRHGLN
ncbi:hypothetical protein C8R45DRAFT_928809 [Mycena sanguinolenta]|nr:hypothetical protein C8R45DRAFT_928809 [Mycena sanguinolenta]